MSSTLVVRPAEPGKVNRISVSLAVGAPPSQFDPSDQVSKLPEAPVQECAAGAKRSSMISRWGRKRDTFSLSRRSSRRKGRSDRYSNARQRRRNIASRSLGGREDGTRRSAV